MAKKKIVNIVNDIEQIEPEVIVDIYAARMNVTTDMTIATTEKLGGIIVGENLHITEEGVLSAQKSATSWNELQDKPTVPSKTSELVNDSNFITNLVDDLVNYYSKNETYTKIELEDKLSKIPKFGIEVVQELPTTNISETTIYLLTSGLPTELNSFEEYIYINSKWELLGTTGSTVDIDLSDYATKQELEQAIADIDIHKYALMTDLPTSTSDLINDSDFITNTELTTVSNEVHTLADALTTTEAQLKSDINMKLDRMDSGNTYDRAYVVDKTGHTVHTAISDIEIADTIAKRNADGQLVISDGTDSNHAVTKKQLDNQQIKVAAKNQIGGIIPGQTVKAQNIFGVEVADNGEATVHIDTLSSYVTKITTVNGKALATNIELTADDISNVAKQDETDTELQQLDAKITQLDDNKVTRLTGTSDSFRFYALRPGETSINYTSPLLGTAAVSAGVVPFRTTSGSFKMPSDVTKILDDEAVPKQYIDDIKTDLSNKLSQIPKFAITVVDALPEADISETTVYLLKLPDSDLDDAQNLYEEYIYVNNSWELLGTAKVDLSDYVTNQILIDNITPITDALATKLSKIPIANQNTVGGIKQGTVDKSAQNTFNVSVDAEGIATVTINKLSDFANKNITINGHALNLDSITITGSDIGVPTGNAIGCVKAGKTDTVSNTYGVDVAENGAMTVNVPQTEYTAGTGITISNNSISSNLDGGGTKTAGKFYTGTTAPTSTDRLNYDGYYYATKVYNAVYNDYAEYRLCLQDIPAGFIVTENEDLPDYVKLCETRNPKAKIFVVSDTFGTCMGEEKNSVPVALSGRALVYFNGNKKKLRVGDYVGCDNDGKARKISRLTALFKPQRILGTVSSICSYKTWGTNNIKVDGRIWVNIK